MPARARGISAYLRLPKLGWDLRIDEYIRALRTGTGAPTLCASYKDPRLSKYSLIIPRAGIVND